MFSAQSRGDRAGYNRNKVASPKQMKNPLLSVIAVIVTDEPSAGPESC